MARLSAAVIPTVYEELFTTLPALLRREQPDAILLLGLAGSTPYLRIETRAANRASSLFADAARRKTSCVLTPGGPYFLAVRAPVHRLLRATRGGGLDTRLSVSAGSYICNAALFRTLEAPRGKPAPLVAFVHIPWPRPHRRRRPGRRDIRPTASQIEHAALAAALALIGAARHSRMIDPI